MNPIRNQPKYNKDINNKEMNPVRTQPKWYIRLQAVKEYGINHEYYIKLRKNI